ncbi:hypothetical protein A9995_07095 [Erythrobacter sp. QSSC1-22B]|uniref:HupE/UreJ family protein n=1 Tax=Erythrobacter sp. QSSC1-22B TaxID=1860125 RepID=UPI0008059C34|nr:HupE/UreJ family protein [Erythrobacter sp. QSSC1-22B]OBX19510.1 hypothetical protein A9995_07095 [Erythrobacter sp. QSSC1-22B]
MAGTRIGLAARLLFFWVVANFSALALAHVTPNSEGQLDLYDDRVELEVIIPAAEYSFASEHPAANDAQSLKLAETYLSNQIGLISPSGNRWTTEIYEARFVSDAGPIDLRGRIVLRPPAGEGARSFDLVWNAVVREVPDHFALVMLRSDWGGKIGSQSEVLGSVRNGNTVVKVRQGRSSEWTRFANAVRLGADHILQGLDHLAFLLALVLTAPLLFQEGKWQSRKDLGPSIRSVAILISGFTVGHSATLIAASLWGWSLPSGPVEVVISLSILVAALHALKPIFPQREAFAATAFGLVHGLGFAGFLSSTDAELSRNIVTLLGFNLGIELMQLAIASVVVSALVILASTRFYSWVRVGLALVCAFLALFWTFDRLVGLPINLVEATDAAIEALSQYLLVTAFIVILFGIYSRTNLKWFGRFQWFSRFGLSRRPS